MTKDQAKALADAMKKEFDGDAQYELVNSPGRYRFVITSKRFETMTQLQRQDEVWAVADRTLARDAIMDISIILAFAPADLAATQ
jgi:acid stress-induced BolA-like protein IbaG/YrbA